MNEPSRRIAGRFSALTSRASLVFLVVFAIALLLLGRAENFMVEKAREVALDWVVPVIHTVASPFITVRDLFDEIAVYSDLHEKNERLQAEVDELKDWKAHARELELQLARYEALLNVQPDPSIDYITGQIVAETGGPFVEAVLVDVGRAEGAASGDAVIDGNGLVGRIVATGDKASRVLLLTDLNSRVPVMIEPGEARAVLAGDNTRWPKIEYISANVPVGAGARVFTSGDGGLIPPGLPVGTLIAMRDGSWRVALLSGDKRVDYVRVLKYVFPNKVDRLGPPDSLKNAPPYKAPEAQPVSGTPPVVTDPAGNKTKKPAPPVPPAPSVQAPVIAPEDLPADAPGIPDAPALPGADTDQRGD